MEEAEQKRGAFSSLRNLWKEITGQKRAEEEFMQAKHIMEEALRIKSEFTSMVSHEMRTPLTSIKQGIEIVYQGEAGELNQKQKEFLEVAKRNVDRLHRLINDVLDFHKLEAGKIEPKLRPGDLAEEVREVVKIEERILKERDIKLNLSVEQDLPETSFDTDLIHQVLMNYLTNAIKYSEKGEISVKVEHDALNPGIKVCVEDSGPGIAKEDLPKLFNRFQQLGGINGRKTGGTGLGLAIAKQIVELHKGRVWVESEVGRGSKFYFSIPSSQSKKP